ncbi:hypothetical protein AMTR_s00053p00073700 [Amborella trichopoda]|uniref:Uncharacterized protein n=1 Tax=Amborella trichopoda TaxID=13333 RepID=W1PBQ7_AMBTC|nr:hypothetical protein AMTR_s00053p00073700 [Amborella trichopoda]
MTQPSAQLRVSLLSHISLSLTCPRLSHEPNISFPPPHLTPLQSPPHPPLLAFKPHSLIPHFYTTHHLSLARHLSPITTLKVPTPQAISPVESYLHLTSSTIQALEWSLPFGHSTSVDSTIFVSL